MKNKHYIVFFLFLLGFYSLGTVQFYGQEYKINRIPETSNTVIYSIIQDREGAVWFSGELGIIKHNVYHLSFYQHDPFTNSLSNNDVGCLYAGRDGTIWAATWGGGVNRFDPQTGIFSHLKHHPGETNSISDNRVQNIYEDRTGMMWFGTYAGGLNRYNPMTGEFIRFYHQPSNSNSLSHNRIWCVTEDSSGALWIATDGGLDRLDKNRRFFTHFYHDPKNEKSIASNQIQWVYIDRDQVLWIATKNGLNRFDVQTNSFKRYQHQPGNSNSLSSNVTYSILEDHSGYLWVGTNGGGLNRLEKKTGRILRLYHEPKNTNSLSNNDIRSVFEDQSGVLWIGTRGGGVNTIDLKPKKFYHVQHDLQNPKSLSHNTVTSFTADRDGQLWIGTDGGGVNLYSFKDNSNTIILNQPKKKGTISHNRIRTVFSDRNGRIWIGTYGGGLNQYRPESRDFISYVHKEGTGQGLSNDRVHVICEDHQGLLWIGTDEGLNRFNPVTGEFKVYLNSPMDSNSLSHNSVVSLYHDRSGILWIGTWGGGLNRFDSGTGIFTRYMHQPGNDRSISNNEIFCIYEDQNRRMWIGTRGGLNRMDRTTHTFRSYTTDHGLPINEVWGILEDANNHLWISTTNGLSRFQPASEIFRNYDMDDGLQGRQFKQGAYYKDHTGRMFFGGVNGYNWFYSDSIHDNTYIPPLSVNTFLLMGQPRSLSLREISESGIRLKHDQNSFSIDFAAMDYTNPPKNQYAYKLEGFNERWVYSGVRHYASYTNLDPGEYVFIAKGSNSDGIWNENGLHIKIQIVPPFWSSWWFRLIAGFAVLALAFAGYQLRIRSIKQHQRTLEQQVMERTVELTGSRNELENKKNQLEKINLIVQAINTEIHLDQLLNALIRETELIQGTIRASAYVAHQDSDEYHLAATTDETEMSGFGYSFSGEEFRSRQLSRASELFPNIFAVRSPLGSEQNRIYQTVIFRIHMQHHTEGYLVFMATDHDGIKFYELSLLNDLREHIISAFIKAKLLFDLKRTNNELTHLNNTKNEFLGIAAHDLRNPLTAIIGYIDLILEDMNSEHLDKELIKKDLNTVLKSAQQMVQLITDLLDISAIESGKISLDLQCNDINTVFEECEKLHCKTSQQKRIGLAVEKNPRLPKTVFDKSRITEVVDNLLSNAIKYTQPGGKVRLFSSFTDHMIEVHVQDTGLGLSDDDMKDLFTGLKRLSNKPTGGETSTGLGLVIVKKIMDLHGGEVRVISRKGEGSTFIISLPLISRMNDV